MTSTVPVLEHNVPTIHLAGTSDRYRDASVRMTLNEGATLYELHVHTDGTTVTVYLSHDQNRDLMADVGAVLAALQAGSTYAGAVPTMGGVRAAADRPGLIRTVLEPAGWKAIALTANDGQGEEVCVYLNQAGAEQLLMGTALMAGHL